MVVPTETETVVGFAIGIDSESLASTSDRWKDVLNPLVILTASLRLNVWAPVPTFSQSLKSLVMISGTTHK